MTMILALASIVVIPMNVATVTTPHVYVRALHTNDRLLPFDDNAQGFSDREAQCFGCPQQAREACQSGT